MGLIFTKDEKLTAINSLILTSGHVTSMRSVRLKNSLVSVILFVLNYGLFAHTPSSDSFCIRVNVFLNVGNMTQ
jgi:hypothetical protein